MVLYLMMIRDTTAFFFSLSHNITNGQAFDSGHPKGAFVNLDGVESGTWNALHRANGSLTMILYYSLPEDYISRYIAIADGYFMVFGWAACLVRPDKQKITSRHRELDWIPNHSGQKIKHLN